MTERDGPAVLVDDFLVHAEFARDWAATAAKASLISMADRSAALVLIFFRAAEMALAGCFAEQHVRPRYEGVVFVVYSWTPDIRVIKAKSVSRTLPYIC